MTPILIECHQYMCPMRSIEVEDIAESKAVENEEFEKSGSKNSVNIQEIEINDRNSASELKSENNIYPLKVSEVSEVSAKSTTSKIQLLKCPKCKFQNIHRETIEHHMKDKHQQNEQKSADEQQIEK
jgi:hypothetical protein